MLRGIAGKIVGTARIALYGRYSSGFGVNDKAVPFMQ